MWKPLNMRAARWLDRWGGLVLCGMLFGWSRVRARLGGPPQPPLRSTTPPMEDGAPPVLRRVLAIKLYGLGNIVMLLPILTALRRAYPDAEIDFLTMAENRPLVERSGVANRVIAVDGSGFAAVARGLVRLVFTLWSRRYDLVVDFEQFVKFSAILAYLTNAPERIGFNTDGQRRGWLYTKRVVYTDSEHMSRIFLRVLRPLGIAQVQSASLPEKPEEEAVARKLLSDHGVEPGRFPLVAVHVGSGPNFYRVPLKRWSPARFAGLCDRLIKEHEAVIVLTGKGEEERSLIDDVLSGMKYDAISACDQLTIMELMALLRRCDLTIANDTSVMHMAAFVRTPVLAFFGPTSPLHYGPGNPGDMVLYRDLYCSPCLTNYNLKVSRCADPVCIRTITVDEVLERVGERFPSGAGTLRSPRDEPRLGGGRAIGGDDHGDSRT